MEDKLKGVAKAAAADLICLDCGAGLTVSLKEQYPAQNTLQWDGPTGERVYKAGSKVHCKHCGSARMRVLALNGLVAEAA